MIYESFSLYKNGHLAPLTQRPTAKSLRPLSNCSFLSEYRSLWLMTKAIDISNVTSQRIKKSFINENLVHFFEKFFFLIKYLNLVRTIMKTSINTRQRPKQLKLNMPKRLIKYQVSGYTKKKAKERV